MEGQLLSRRPQGRSDAALLRVAVSFLRDQQLVLSNSRREDAAPVARAGVPRVSLRPQSATEDHAFHAIEGRVATAARVLRYDRTHTRRATRSDPVSAAAQHEGGRASPGGLSRICPGGY